MDGESGKSMKDAIGLSWVSIELFFLQNFCLIVIGLTRQLKQQYIYWMWLRVRNGEIERPPQTLLLVSMALSLLGWLLPGMNGAERELEMPWYSFTTCQMRVWAKVC